MVDDAMTIDGIRDSAGRAILALTDRVGFDCYAAAWMVEHDGGIWRFVLSTPMLTSHGPRWLYERLAKLFRHDPLPPGVTLLDIHLIDPGLELALFGLPPAAADSQMGVPEVGLFGTGESNDGKFLELHGSVFFYRRLPMAQRQRRHDASRRFDTKIRQLEAA